MSESPTVPGPATSERSDDRTGRAGLIEAVLFDMGGVLVRLGSLPDLLGAQWPSAEFWPRWLSSSAVRRYERGQCSTDEFAIGVVQELGLTIGPQEFLANFARFPRGLYPGAAELVEEVSRKVVTGVLSNTNELHWETQPDADRLKEIVRLPYLSYRLDAVKPDAAIYQLVLQDLGLDGSNVLFLDDNEINVAGARQVGLKADVADGVDEARSILADHGLASAAYSE